MNAAQRALGMKVLDHIEAHPDQHYQGFYGRRTECGTVACVAGWAIILAEDPRLLVEWRPAGTPAHALMVVFDAATGRRIDPYEAARDLLGLGPAAAQRLFLFTLTRKAPARLRELLYAVPVSA